MLATDFNGLMMHGNFKELLVTLGFNKTLTEKTVAEKTQPLWTSVGRNINKETTWGSSTLKCLDQQPACDLFLHWYVLQLYIF